jgi:hypothetical protein
MLAPLRYLVSFLGYALNDPTVVCTAYLVGYQTTLLSCVDYIDFRRSIEPSYSPPLLLVDPAPGNDLVSHRTHRSVRLLTYRQLPTKAVDLLDGDSLSRCSIDKLAHVLTIAIVTL